MPTNKIKSKKKDSANKTTNHLRQNSENLFLTEAPFSVQTGIHLQETKDDMRIRSSLDSFTIPSCEKLIAQCNTEKPKPSRLTERPLTKATAAHVKISIGNSKLDSKVRKREWNESNINQNKTMQPSLKHPQTPSGSNKVIKPALAKA